jgi:hypothetical protein
MKTLSVLLLIFCASLVSSACLALPSAWLDSQILPQGTKLRFNQDITFGTGHSTAHFLNGVQVLENENGVVAIGIGDVTCSIRVLSLPKRNEYIVLHAKDPQTDQARVLTVVKVQRLRNSVGYDSFSVILTGAAEDLSLVCRFNHPNETEAVTERLLRTGFGGLVEVISAPVAPAQQDAPVPKNI